MCLLHLNRSVLVKIDCQNTFLAWSPLVTTQSGVVLDPLLAVLTSKSVQITVHEPEHALVIVPTIMKLMDVALGRLIFASDMPFR